MVITPTILLFITLSGLWKAVAELDPVKDVSVHRHGTAAVVLH